MGEVREMLDGWWNDGFDFAWATRELAEQAHEQKKNFTGPVPTRDYEVETEQEAVDANRQEIDGMFAALDDKIDHAAKIRNAEISAANAARNAGAHARDEMLAGDKLNAEILSAHRAAAPVAKAEPLVFKMDEGTAEALGMKPFEHELAVDAARKDVTEGANEDDEKLVQEGMKMYLKIEEAIEIHAKLEDAILIDIIGTRVFMAQLKGVLVGLRKDVIGDDA